MITTIPTKTIVNTRDIRRNFNFGVSPDLSDRMADYIKLELKVRE